MDQHIVGPGIDQLSVIAVGARLESLYDLDVEVPGSLGTPNRISFRPSAARDDFAVLIAGGEPGSSVAPIESVQRLAHPLDVLPRHRPRSIPRPEHAELPRVRPYSLSPPRTSAS